MQLFQIWQPFGAVEEAPLSHNRWLQPGNVNITNSFPDSKIL